MKKTKKRTKYLLLLLILFISVGYAILQSNLTITGTTSIQDSKWDIHWNNVVITTGSVSTSNADKATIDNTKTTVNYNIVLDKPGDFYEFTVDAVNEGTIDGMIDTISSKLNNVEITTLPAYLNYSITYSDGTPLQGNQELKANSSETYKVRIEYKRDIEASQLPETTQTLNLSFSVTYKQATDDAVPVPHSVSFADDSWSTIVAAVQSGNTGNYNVGDTKEVDMGTFGTHTLRIANMSTPSECSTEGFSQTACGFVLEFADIITTHRMNPYTSEDTTTIGVNSKGGWEYSDMRAFLNSTTYAYENIDYSSTGIYSSLPEVVRNAIINTTVVSGHNSNDTTNFTTIDKLYLLSTHEVWEDVDGNTNSGIDYYDTAYNNTRQLDYYKNLNVTTSNYSGAIKQNSGSSSWWWLRSARSITASTFYYVGSYGDWRSSYADNTGGVSPAFRIG